MSVARVRKAIIAIIAALVILAVTLSEVFADWLSAEAVGWIATVVAFLGAVAVYLTRNAELIDNIGTGRNLGNPPAPPPVA